MIWIGNEIYDGKGVEIHIAKKGIILLILFRRLPKGLEPQFEMD